MRKPNVLGLLSFLLFAGACSGDKSALVTTTTTTTTVPVTTTTIDEEALKESQRNVFKSELFQDLEWWRAYDTPDAPAAPSEFFATIEEIQQVLRKYAISGFVVTNSIPWTFAATPQRKVCDNIILDDVIAELEPTNIVGRFFTWDGLKAVDFSRGTVLATGGMHVFETPPSDKLRGLAGSVVDKFNAGGGECQVRPNFYSVKESDWTDKWGKLPFQHWWNDNKLVDSGIATLKTGRVTFETLLLNQVAEVGFQFLQYGINENWIRDFFVFTYPELGLVVLIEVNIFENAPTSKSPSTVEFADQYLDVAAELQLLLFKNLNNYLNENDLNY